MSATKLKRTEEEYETQVSSNRGMSQPVLFNSLVTQNGEQYLEIDPINFENFQNSEANLLYYLLPKELNDSDDLETLYVLPGIGQQTNDELNYCLEPDLIDINDLPNYNVDDDVIMVEDDEVANCNETDDQELSDDYEEDHRPLNIREHVSYAIARRYNDVILEAPKEEVIKHNEFLWRTQIKCDHPGCKVVLTSYYEKKLHMDDHNYPASTTYKCSICNMVFHQAGERNKHVESHSVANTYKCDECFKTFAYYTSYVQHLHDEKCTHRRLFTCRFCGLHFVHINEQRLHEINIKTCVCDTKMCSKEAFNLHINACNQYKKKLNRRSKKQKLSNVSIHVLE